MTVGNLTEGFLLKKGLQILEFKFTYRVYVYRVNITAVLHIVI